jgi:hypothetical protein
MERLPSVLFYKGYQELRDPLKEAQESLSRWLERVSRGGSRGSLEEA